MAIYGSGVMVDTKSLIHQTRLIYKRNRTYVSTQRGSLEHHAARRCSTKRQWSLGKNVDEAPGLDRLGCMLACVLVFQYHGMVVPVAHADDSNVSAYERKKIENDRRKEMLRSLREKAEQGASRVDATPAPPVYTPSVAPSIPKNTVPQTTPSPAAREAPSKHDDTTTPATTTATTEKQDLLSVPSFDMPKMPSFSGFGGSGGDNDKEKPVVPTPPQKTYAPPQVAMPESSSKPSATRTVDTVDQWRQQQKKDLATRKKVEKQAERNNKARKGAIPTWLAEFLMIGSFIGFGFASIVFGNQISAIYKNIDRALTGLFSTK